MIWSPTQLLTCWDHLSRSFLCSYLLFLTHKVFGLYKSDVQTSRPNLKSVMGEISARAIQAGITKIGVGACCSGRKFLIPFASLISFPSIFVDAFSKSSDDGRDEEAHSVSSVRLSSILRPWRDLFPVIALMQYTISWEKSCHLHLHHHHHHRRLLLYIIRVWVLLYSEKRYRFTIERLFNLLASSICCDWLM